MLEVVALGAIIEINELIGYEEYCRELEYLRELGSATKPQKRRNPGSFWKPVSLGLTVNNPGLFERLCKEYRREQEYSLKKGYRRELDSATKPQRRRKRGSFLKPVSLEFTVKHPNRFERRKFTASRAPRPDGYSPIPIKIMLNEYGGLSGEADEPSISALEFVDLSDGCRIGLRDGRGWGLDWALNTANSQWAIANGRNQANRAILILDPEDDDEWESWIIEELHRADIDVDPASVHAAPYRIEFGPHLQDMLRQPKR